VPGWRVLTAVQLAGSVVVLISEALRRWPFDRFAYVAIAAFGFLAIRSAYVLIKNVRPDA